LPALFPGEEDDVLAFVIWGLQSRCAVDVAGAQSLCESECEVSLKTILFSGLEIRKLVWVQVNLNASWNV
jgi:hypothetical protein